MSVILKLFNREWQIVEPNDNQKNFLQAISTEDQKQGMEIFMLSYYNLVILSLSNRMPPNHK